MVAFQISGRFHVIEIKSFAVIDGQADEESVAAAAMQAAAYILALQDLLTAESLPLGAVSADVILVTPENFTPNATATFLDVRKQVSVLRRQLARMTRIGILLDQLPPGLTFDLAPGPDGDPARPRGELAMRTVRLTNTTPRKVLLVSGSVGLANDLSAGCQARETLIAQLPTAIQVPSLPDGGPGRVREISRFSLLGSNKPDGHELVFRQFDSEASLEDPWLADDRHIPCVNDIDEPPDSGRHGDVPVPRPPEAEVCDPIVAGTSPSDVPLTGQRLEHASGRGVDYLKQEPDAPR